MKVQLAAEDIERQLLESSGAIVRRVSSASTDIEQLQVMLLSIGESVDALATQVSADERSSAQAAARLRQLDTVKTRVLGAKSTLQVLRPFSADSSHRAARQRPQSCTCYILATTCLLYTSPSPRD